MDGGGAAVDASGACIFHRDLFEGDYGPDVACLQARGGPGLARAPEQGDQGGVKKKRSPRRRKLAARSAAPGRPPLELRRRGAG